MAEPFLGEIRLVPFSFAPKGWALCDGQTLSLSQNTALFSLLGTYYGGNGTSNFQLPNLQGRVAIGMGQGPGLSYREIGENGGETSLALNLPELPSHQHTMEASSAAATAYTPVGNVPAKSTHSAYTSSKTSNLNVYAVTLTGGNQPHNNLQPLLTLNYVIALQGIFPSRA
jgi:microcystin-dependent protein